MSGLMSININKIIWSVKMRQTLVHAQSRRADGSSIKRCPRIIKIKLTNISKYDKNDDSSSELNAQIYIKYRRSIS